MKYYAVKTGRQTGIFTDWASCKAQVDGYSGAEYKSFPTESAAREYLTGAEPEQFFGTVAYVDGSYNVKTGEFSYGAVILNGETVETYCEKFSDPELSQMRNVAGEIKGAEFVLKYCLEKGIKSVKLVYDYAGIENWATGAWQTNKTGTKAYKSFYDTVKRSVFVQFNKVKSHSGDKYNDMADELAKSALGIV